MPATTVDRDTRRRSGDLRSFPVKGATTIPAGAMCGLVSGFLVNALTSTGLTTVGVASDTIVNAGADGAVTANVPTGIFGPFANSASTDAITDAHIGTTCFVVDNQTVARTNGSTTRSAAGTVFKVDTDGVWVRFE